MTCVLHRYFNGDSKTTMIVNISPDSRLIEETMHVLKFAALAQKVEIPRKRLQMPLNPIKRKRVSSLLEKRRSTLMSFNPGFNSTARLSSTEGPFSFRSSVATGIYLLLVNRKYTRIYKEINNDIRLIDLEGTLASKHL